MRGGKEGKWKTELTGTVLEIKKDDYGDGQCPLKRNMPFPPRE